MPVRIKKGNLLDATESVIVHQCNAKGVMGSGVAKALRSKWPQIYPPYKEVVNSGEFALGWVIPVEVEPNRFVVNLIAQENYGRNKKIVYTDYDALRIGMLKVVQHLDYAGGSAAAPYGIGCGLANGDWKIVMGILEEIFVDHELVLYKLY